MDIVTAGRKVRKYFNTIQGQLSEKTQNGYPLNNVIIRFYETNPTFKGFVNEVFHDMDCNICSLSFEFLEHSNKPIVNFKTAGKRLKGQVQAINQDIKLGNFLYEGKEITTPNGKLFENEYYFDKQKEYELVICDKKTTDTDELFEVITFRKKLKKFITEDLNIDIVPSIWKGWNDKTGSNFSARTVVSLVDCKETFLDKLMKWNKEAFKNVLFHSDIGSKLQPLSQDKDYLDYFYQRMRGEIYQSVAKRKSQHEIDGVFFNISTLGVKTFPHHSHSTPAYEKYLKS